MTDADERKKTVTKDGVTAESVDYECAVCKGEMCNGEGAQVLSGGSTKHALMGLVVTSAATTFLL